MCLRIVIGNHQRVCITKLLKSLYPIVHVSTQVRPIYESFLAKHASCMEAGPGGGGEGQCAGIDFITKQ
jgi:hypothetical protein